MLNETQIATLRAAVDRIIPPDDQYPGGVEVGALDYLLRHLAEGGDLHPHLNAYQTGLDEIDRLARKTHAAPFFELSEVLQDAVLIAYEQHAPRFFRLLVEQTQEGFYTSPRSWEMIGWKVNG
jgi:hypothetical protein